MNNIDQQYGIGIFFYDLAGIAFRRAARVDTYCRYLILKASNKRRAKTVVTAQGITNTDENDRAFEYVRKIAVHE